MNKHQRSVVGDYAAYLSQQFTSQLYFLLTDFFVLRRVVHGQVNISSNSIKEKFDESIVILFNHR